MIWKFGFPGFRLVSVVSDMRYIYPMTTSRQLFGMALAKLMDDNNQSTSDVAHVFGCRRVAVWKWQKGMRIPKGSLKRKLLEAYPSLAGLLRLAERG